MMLSEKMLTMQQAREDADREWQRQESERQRQWEAEQARLAGERHEANLRVAMSGSRGNVWSNIIGGVIAAIAAIAAVYLSNLLPKQNTGNASQVSITDQAGNTK